MLVEFYASWCQACVQMRPVMEKLAAEYGQRVDFKVYDVGGAWTEKQRYKYAGQPQYDIVNAKGEIVAIRNGYQNYQSLKADLDAVLAVP